MSSFEEILIQEVFLRPCLYNKQNPEKRLRNVTNKCWKEISEKCGKSVVDCKKKWTGLKDTFNRRSKKPPSGSGNEEDDQPKWQWYQQLSFLKEFNTPLPPQDNISQDSSVPREEENEQNLADNEQNDQGIEGNMVEQDVLPAGAENTVTIVFPPMVTHQSTPSSSTQVTQQPTPVTKQYGNSKKGKRASESIEDKWEKVFDKISDAAESVSGNTTQDSSPSFLFGKYVASEMERMTEAEQDKIKFAVFDAIQDVKRARMQ